MAVSSLGYRKRVRGMTLIELMIVVSIIGIIAAIAYPSYQEQIRKTRRAEGRAALAEVQTRLERCYTRFNAYDHDACKAVAKMTSEGGYYQVTATAITSASYALKAEPQDAQRSDTKCGSLTLTHVGVRGQSGSPPTGYNCW